MKFIGYLCAAFLLLAMVQAALTVLFWVIIGSIVIGLVTRPWQTLGVLTAVVVLGMATRYPLPGAMVILALCILAALPEADSETT
ncbi:hypothetical protein [Novosphingobium sp. Leaf2]|uniref:hypothetical protein n=1 Tax=Novosphingobium sp. Leaf2 TaxID=1735670 RepID=UPI0006F37F1F|nr:hypothetical protein [Novosphingobium sp. Leaf2]KQM13890.1 hypothetical protein ASE49_12715 [Novosphingobium sp. Leaf2]